MISRARAATFLRRARTPARLVQQMAQLAVQAQKVTPLTAAGLVATAIGVLHEAVGSGGPGRCLLSLPLPLHVTVPALASQCWSVMPDSNPDYVTLVRGSDEITCGRSGVVAATCDDAAKRRLTDAVSASLAAALPQSLDIHPEASDAWYCGEIALTHFDAPLGAEILAQTRPLLDPRGTRCILLNGPPGVGKSTIARQIAAGLPGRTIVLTRVVHAAAESVQLPFGFCALDAFSHLAPHTIIVDDIDKCHLNLDILEALRGACRLLILTANNGNRDDVLDGALARPGRIDEEFQVTGTSRRDAQFDALDEATWQRIAAWPIAYQQEVAARLKRGNTPAALGLDELERRLQRRTRSGDIIAREDP